MLRSSFFVGLIVIFAVGFSLTARPREEKKPTPIQRAYEMARDNTALIFQRSCALSGCHRGEYPKAKLDLEAEKWYAATVDVPSLQIDTLKLVDTVDPEKSYLLMKIRGAEGIARNRMPLNAAPLGSDDIKTIRLWIHALNILNTD
jgi:hypothetical protein